MDSQKQQILERIKQANNILITVSANPSVDQLAACLGLTIMLNELGKHATAVFSGAVPSTIEFLQPEKTIEKNTDSLRDFIIALDKSKADKLRYKVEDTVVKIFITPYRTSISDKDLEFSQGDFNVEAVIALGVHDQKELDQAITAHGRILHDATVISINTTPGNNLGTINWQDPKASSLSEMVSSLAENFDKQVLDNQVATALLTGIVAETDRFSNNRTTPETMKASAQLMAAGANQQLVATKLQAPPPEIPIPPAPAQSAGDDKGAADTAKSDDGTLHIEHDDADSTALKAAQQEAATTPEKQEEPENTGPQIHIDETGNLHSLEDSSQTPAPVPDLEPTLMPPKPEPPKKLNEEREFLSGPGPSASGGIEGVSAGDVDDDEKPSGEPLVSEGSKFVFTPPALGGTLTANSRPEALEPTTDPLSSTAANQPILSHADNVSAPTNPNPASLVMPPDNAEDTNTPTVTPSDGGDSPTVVQPTNTNVSSDDNKDDAAEPALPLILPEANVASDPPQTEDMPLPSTPSFDLPEPQLGSGPVDAPEPTVGLPPAQPLGAMPEPTAAPSTPAADDSSAPTPTPEPITPVMTSPIAPLDAADMGATGTSSTSTNTSDDASFTPDVSTARDAVLDAIDGAGPTPPSPPIAALNAQPLGGPLHDQILEDAIAPPIQPLGNPNFDEPAPDAASPSAQPLDMPLPSNLTPPAPSTTPPTSSQTNDPSAPPPVPPPLIPPFGGSGF